MRKTNFLWLGLAALSAAVLYHTSQQVTDGHQKVLQLEASIQKEDESMRVLAAEWSYLNQPERLEKLSRQYLPLEPMKGSQFVRENEIDHLLSPAAADAPQPQVAAAEPRVVAAQPQVVATDEKQPPQPAPAEDVPLAAAAPAPAVEKAPVKQAVAAPIKKAAPQVAAKKSAPAQTAAVKTAAPKIAKSLIATPPQHVAVTKTIAKPAATAQNASRDFGDVMKGLGVQ